MNSEFGGDGEVLRKDQPQRASSIGGGNCSLVRVSSVGMVRRTLERAGVKCDAVALSGNTANLVSMLSTGRLDFSECTYW